MGYVDIFDAYPFLYGGTYATSSEHSRGGFTYAGFRALFDKVLNTALLGEAYKTLVIFDSKTTQEFANREYKANRSPNTAVLAQADFALEKLQAIGIPCIKEDFVEADDIICAAVKELEANDDVFRINVYTDDEDLAHCVSMITNLQPATSNGKLINPNNFSTACSKSRSFVLYNTVSAFKFFTGCQSDTIKSLPGGVSLYDDFKQYIKEKFPYIAGHELKEPSYLANYILDRMLPTELYDADALVDRMNLIYPKEYALPSKASFYEIAQAGGVKNKELAIDLSRLTYCRNNLKLLGAKPDSISTGLAAELNRKGQDLIHGVIAANAGIPPEMDLLGDFRREF